MASGKKKKLLQERLNEIANTYGTLNELDPSSDDPIANRRSLSPETAISQVISSRFTADVLRNRDEFLGVVLASIPSTEPRLSSTSQKFETMSTTFKKRGSKRMFFVYKVLIPELESRCIILNKKQEEASGGLTMAQRIGSMADVGLDVSLYNASEGIRAIAPGSLVKVTYDDLARMKGPKIVAVYKKVFNFSPTAGVRSNKDAHRAGRKRARGLKGPPAPPGLLSSHVVDLYAPGSEKAKVLLRKALVQADLPVEWADLESLHKIMKNESGGKVGIPNYTYESIYGDARKRPDAWPEIWEMAARGEWGHYKGRSTATGLGQLLYSNVKTFYPGGTTGIGKPLPEAVGFVKYIHSRYGDPDVAWSVYGKGGKGAAYDQPEPIAYTNSRTGKKMTKGFQQGY